MDGRPVKLRNTAQARRAGVAFVPESRRAMLFPEEPVFKNIPISMLRRIGRLLLHPAAERAIADRHGEAARDPPAQAWTAR